MTNQYIVVVVYHLSLLCIVPPGCAHIGGTYPVLQNHVRGKYTPENANNFQCRGRARSDTKVSTICWAGPISFKIGVPCARFFTNHWKIILGRRALHAAFASNMNVFSIQCHFRYTILKPVLNAQGEPRHLLEVSGDNPKPSLA